MDPGEAFEQQGRACAVLGSPMYAGLCARLAEDVRSGGVTAEVLAGHEGDAGPSALALRLLGSLHRLVLERRAGALAAYFPSVGGTWDLEAGSLAALDLMGREPESVREWLDRPPQTNEVGRAAALMGGLLQLGEEHRLPLRLVEIGSSGGLNLLADRFRYLDGDGREYGDLGSPVVLDPAWLGPGPLPWLDLTVVERRGCDLIPVDVRTTAGRLALTAYVWPDQPARYERLRGAMHLAQQTPPDVRRQGAADFLDELDLRDGTTTVLWHSVMWQYLPDEERTRADGRIEQLGERASPAAPFAHLAFEPTRRAPGSEHEFLVVLTTWPGGVRRVLGRATPHGVPVLWEPAPQERGGSRLDPTGAACEAGGPQDDAHDPGGTMADTGENDDLKVKMREALERKQANDRGVPQDRPVKEKAHGSEVSDNAPKMHRRKAGGGGS